MAETTVAAKTVKLIITRQDAPDAQSYTESLKFHTVRI